MGECRRVASSSMSDFRGVINSIEILLQSLRPISVNHILKGGNLHARSLSLLYGRVS